MRESENPKILAEIAKQKACGKSGKEIAKRMNIGERKVYRILEKDEIKKYIDDMQNEMISTCLEPTKANLKYLITTYQTNENQQEKDHAFKAMQEILKISGITPTMNQSVFIQNLYQDNRNQIISPVMQEVLSKFADSMKLTEEDMAVEVNYAVEKG